jgi:hypothetical protein
MKEDARIEQGLLRLVNRGSLRLGPPNSAELYPLLPRALRSATLSTLLDAERGDR